ncbi:leucine rich repeat protein [Plakobranchus ocellatus]|uniref:Leucine rich repeat protein n=1 Tax=Plakobranchus ocellatus TaxID=259542 RepID=A0AAV4BL85_9GAST|nr:leucine rich repeat protein [Plakobranchus ocellatus]
MLMLIHRASNIGDVSVVRRMPALEVCSLSINKITGLRDFAHCHNLKELYVRTNRIERLGDIHYLKHLRKLRSLWLSENPCAGEPNYRMTVLKTLPNLRKLDNVAVTEDEVQKAEAEGNQLPIPEDFSSSSMFGIDALSVDNRNSSDSPPDSARSLDSHRSGAESAGSSVRESVKSSVADSVTSVCGSDGRWALPRRKRQQRKREEMLRSSGEEGGSEALSKEKGSGGGDGERSDSHVSGSSDSTQEEENSKEDSLNMNVEVNSLSVCCEEGKSSLDNSQADLPTIESEGNGCNEAAGSGKLGHKSEHVDEMMSPNFKAPSAMNKEGLNVKPEFPPVPERIGSIDVLRISDLEETSGSGAVLSNDNTLVCTADAEVKRENNNNDDSDAGSSDHKDDKSLITGHSSAESNVSTKPSQETTDKENKHFLLDQIRLNDSLDVMDSAADNTNLSKSRVANSTDLEHPELEIEADVSSALHLKKESDAQVTCLGPDNKKIDSVSLSTQTSRSKPPIPAKTRSVHINWEEHNRLRAELGVRPIDSIKSTSVSTNMEVTKARNSNILQAVLCLLKELDKDSLDIVGAAVKARVEAME